MGGGWGCRLAPLDSRVLEWHVGSRYRWVHTLAAAMRQACLVGYSVTRGRGSLLLWRVTDLANGVTQTLFFGGSIVCTKRGGRRQLGDLGGGGGRGLMPPFRG